MIVENKIRINSIDNDECDYYHDTETIKFDDSYEIDAQGIVKINGVSYVYDDLCEFILNIKSMLDRRK